MYATLMRLSIIVCVFVCVLKKRGFMISYKQPAIQSLEDLVDEELQTANQNKVAQDNELLDQLARDVAVDAKAQELWKNAGGSDLMSEFSKLADSASVPIDTGPSIGGDKSVEAFNKIMFGGSKK